VIKINIGGDLGDGRPRPPSKKQLALSISFAKNPIVRGNTQTITVMVSDASTKSPVSGASVSISLTSASSSTKKSFSGTSDNSGKVSFSFAIGGNSKPGIFTVYVQASAAGYKSASKTRSFEVIAKNDNTTLPFVNDTIVINDTTGVMPNDTGIIGNETGFSNGEEGDTGSDNGGNVTLNHFDD
jgi:large repetitive protein